MGVCRWLAASGQSTKIERKIMSDCIGTGCKREALQAEIERLSELLKRDGPIFSCANAFSQHPGKCGVWCGDSRTCPKVEQAASSGVRAA